MPKRQGSEHHLEFELWARIAGVRPKGPKWKPRLVPVILGVFFFTRDSRPRCFGFSRRHFWLQAFGTFRAVSSQIRILFQTGSSQILLYRSLHRSRKCVNLSTWKQRWTTSQGQRHERAAQKLYRSSRKDETGQQERPQWAGTGDSQAIGIGKQKRKKGVRREHARQQASTHPRQEEETK